MKRAVILVNPYLNAESEFYQARRIEEELFSLEVAADIRPNAYLAHTEREGIAEELSKQYDFCVYLDKDKYTPRLLEAMGMRLFNRAEAVEVCDDKMLTHIALSGIVPMPKTYFAPLCYKESDPVSLGDCLGFPVVVKECYGSFGKQVYLARDEGELFSLSERLKHVPHLYQEYIEESAGRDLRAVCVGGEVVACMERRAEKDFRSNIALGASASPVSASEELRRLCGEVSAALSLDYCGIDLLFGKESLLVCEVNSNAYFGGIERTTGVNVAQKFASFMYKCVYGVGK